MTKIATALLVALCLLASACGAEAEPTLAETTAELVDDNPAAAPEAQDTESEPDPEPTVAPVEEEPTAAPTEAPVTDNATEAAQDLGDNATEAAQDLGDNATEAAQDLGDNATEAAQDLGDNANEDSERDTAPASDLPPIAITDTAPGDPDVVGLTSTAEAPAPSDEPFFVQVLVDFAEITVHGVMESPASFDDEGACITIFYTASPYTADDKRILTDPTPKFGLTIDGEYVDERGNCELTDEAKAAGFRTSLQFAVPGGPISKFTQIQLEGIESPDIESIVVGFPDLTGQDPLVYIEAKVLDQIPTPLRATEVVLPPAQPGTVAENAGQFDDKWTLDFEGIVIEEPRDSFDNRDVCAVVVGTATLTATPSALTGDRTPELDIIAGGLSGRDGGFDCNLANLWEAGYRPLSSAEPTVGSTYHFAEYFLIPADLTNDISTVVVDERFGRGVAQVFDAEIIDANDLPTPEVSLGATLDATESITGAEFAWTDPDTGIVFDVSVAGVINYQRSNRTEADCYAVFGTMTPSADVDSFAAFPEISLVASGLEMPTLGLCSIRPLEDAGYNDYFVDATAGAVFPFYQVIAVYDTPERVVDSVIIGNRDGERLVFNADFIDTLPAAG